MPQVLTWAATGGVVPRWSPGRDRLLATSSQVVRDWCWPRALESVGAFARYSSSAARALWHILSRMRTYRNARWALVTQTFLMSGMALIGVSIAIHPGRADHPGTAPGYIAFGAVIVAVLIFFVVCQLTNRLVVTEQGLTWRNMMRIRTVAWADVQDVLIVGASSRGPWYSPAVKVNGKLIRIGSVIASRRRVESIVTDIRSTCAEARTTTPLGTIDTSPADPSAA